MTIYNHIAIGIVLLTCTKLANAEDQSIYSVKTVAEFSWLADDDVPRLTTSQIYQMENAAATYFGELLEEALEKEEQSVDPLQTKVAITDQEVGLTQTGERLKFDIPSIVDFTYIGTDEIPSITLTLQEYVDASRDSPAYSNLNMLMAGTNRMESFTITFSNTTMEPSTLLYTVEDTSDVDSNNGQAGLIIACILASISLFLASLTLFWAVGRFDGWTICKDFRARFYMPSAKSPPSPIPYGMTAKSTAEETEVGMGAAPMYYHNDEENATQDQGIEMTPSRGVFREHEDESELLSPADSEFTDVTNISHVSSVAPLGIASMRKEKRNAAAAGSPTLSAIGTNAMSPESILADLTDIQAMSMDID